MSVILPDRDDESKSSIVVSPTRRLSMLKTSDPQTFYENLGGAKRTRKGLRYVAKDLVTEPEYKTSLVNDYLQHGKDRKWRAATDDHRHRNSGTRYEVRKRLTNRLASKLAGLSPSRYGVKNSAKIDIDQTLAWVKNAKAFKAFGGAVSIIGSTELLAELINKSLPPQQHLRSADGILEWLEDQGDLSRVETAVLYASDTAFTTQQRPRLLAGLGTFIAGQRFTRDDRTITLVGSAARKFALNMRESDFDGYSRWLEPEQTEYLHERVELELVKGACWRLVYEPVQSKNAFLDLKKVLFQIGWNYTNDRFLLQKNFAAIALNSIVAVFILDANIGQKEFAEQLVERVRNAGREWFGALLSRRLNSTVDDISIHDPDLSQSLRNLIDDVYLIEKDG